MNTASTLQPVSNIRGNLFGEFDIPRVGLEYLPPQGNPPSPQATIPAAPLLLYSTAYYDDPHVGAYSMDRYHHSDMWPGAAWLTRGDRSDVIFVGTKGQGKCWYGNQDGPFLECDNRGWWSTSFDGEIIFYDPDDLAAVAAGTREPYEPQPYAVMKIDDVLYHIDSPQMYDHVKAASFDRRNGLLYVFEPLADGDHPLVHVWKIDGSGAPTPFPFLLRLSRYRSPAWGTITETAPRRSRSSRRIRGCGRSRG